MYIEEISKVNKNGKDFYKLKIDGKSFTVFDSSEGFTQLENKEVESGCDAKVEFSEKEGSFQGKPVVYRNIIKFENVKKGESKSVNNSVNSNSVDWDAKDRRIVRMSCLTRAIEFFELNKEQINKNLGNTEGLTIVSEESVINVAKKFETEYVYGDKE